MKSRTVAEVVAFAFSIRYPRYGVYRGRDQQGRVVLVMMCERKKANTLQFMGSALTVWKAPGDWSATFDLSPG